MQDEAGMIFLPDQRSVNDYVILAEEVLKIVGMKFSQWKTDKVEWRQKTGI